MITNFNDLFAELKAQGLSDDDAANQAPIILEAREMLRKWEAGEKPFPGWIFFEVTTSEDGRSFHKPAA